MRTIKIFTAIFILAIALTGLPFSSGDALANSFSNSLTKNVLGGKKPAHKTTKDARKQMRQRNTKKQETSYNGDEDRPTYKKKKNVRDARKVSRSQPRGNNSGGNRVND